MEVSFSFLVKVLCNLHKFADYNAESENLYDYLIQTVAECLEKQRINYDVKVLKKMVSVVMLI